MRSAVKGAGGSGTVELVRVLVCVRESGRGELVGAGNIRIWAFWAVSCLAPVCARALGCVLGVESPCGLRRTRLHALVPAGSSFVVVPYTAWGYKKKGCAGGKLLHVWCTPTSKVATRSDRIGHRDHLVCRAGIERYQTEFRAG